jgi:cysteinyl-tRNA synthetase
LVIRASALVVAICLAVAASATPLAVAQSARRPWSEVRSWTYWLDSPRLATLTKSGFHLLVIDYARYGDDATRFTAPQLEALRQSCRRRVLAYLSIGQAEDWRWYWQPSWRTDPPAFLAAPDPEWAGARFVRYWDPAWRAIVFAYLDRIVEQGFDGVFLDRVDAYTYPYAAGREQDMVDLVTVIAARARARSPLGADFGVFPQNAEELGEHPAYLAAVTGVGRESGYVFGGARVPERDRRAMERDLDVFTAAGKLVLTVDYVRRSRDVAEVYTRSRSKGYVPYATDRALDRMTVNALDPRRCAG